MNVVMNNRILIGVLSSLVVAGLLLVVVLPGILIKRNDKLYDYNYVKLSAAEFKDMKSYDYSDTEGPLKENGFLATTSNEFLTLFYKKETAEVAVYDKSNGQVWFSNPQDRDGDKIATGQDVHRLKSQLFISYYANNSQIKYMTSYFDSVRLGQYSQETVENGIRVNFTLGKKTYKKVMLTNAVPKDEFENKVLKSLDQKDRDTILSRYKLINLSDFSSEEMKKSMLLKYKNLSKTPLYVLDEYIPDYDVKMIYDLLFKNTYSLSDFNKDNVAAGYTKVLLPETQSFEISIVYRIVGDEFTASVDCSKLKVNETFAIYSCSLLEFFGAGSIKDNGYMLVPDGSGAIIDFNNKKSWATAYDMPVFGRDIALKTQSQKGITEKIQIPVFGIKKNNSGFIAIIEDANSYANIYSNVSGKETSYNYICSKAVINPKDTMSMLNPNYGSGNVEVNVFQKEPYKGMFSVRYAFLSEKNANYSGMAAKYRDYLIKNKILKDRLKGADIPFSFELIGSIEKNKPILGIPLEVNVPLTTFKQAGEIVKRFSDSNIEDMNIQYSGCFNGGMRSTPINSLSVQGALGGKNGFSKMLSQMKEYNTKVYPDIYITTIKKVPPFYFEWTKVSRTTYNEIILKYPYDLANSYFDYKSKYFYLLSPGLYSNYINAFETNYNKLGNDYLSLSDFTTDLGSDFGKDRYTEREKAKSIVEKELKNLSSSYKLIGSKTNSYALSYVDTMVDMPLKSSGFQIFDRDIPFLQMVLGGYKDISSAPLNIDNSDENIMLTLLRNGTSPFYTFTSSNSNEVKGTDYDSLYSTNIDVWFNNALNTFNEYNRIMKNVRGETVVEYLEPMKNVFKVTYSNGFTIMINVTDKEIVLEQIRVKANNYSLVKNGGVVQ
jgi:hypothetical protein